MTKRPRRAQVDRVRRALKVTSWLTWSELSSATTLAWLS